MDIDSLEKEIMSSIREVLKSKGVDGSDIRIKAKTKTTSVEMPVKAQGVIDSKEIVEWPKPVVTIVEMKLLVKFAAPGTN